MMGLRNSRSAMFAVAAAAMMSASAAPALAQDAKVTPAAVNTTVADVPPLEDFLKVCQPLIDKYKGLSDPPASGLAEVFNCQMTQTQAHTAALEQSTAALKQESDCTDSVTTAFKAGQIDKPKLLALIGSEKPSEYGYCRIWAARAALAPST